MTEWGVNRRVVLVESLQPFLPAMDQSLCLLFAAEGTSKEVASSFLHCFEKTPSWPTAAVKLSLYSLFLGHASDSCIGEEEEVWRTLLHQWRLALATSELVPTLVKEEAIASLILFCLTVSSTLQPQCMLLQTYMTTPFSFALHVTYSILHYLLKQDEGLARYIASLNPLPGQHNATLVRLRRLVPSPLPVLAEDAQVTLTTMALSLDSGDLATPEMEATLDRFWQKETSVHVRSLLATMTLRVMGQLDFTRPITADRVKRVVDTVTMRLQSLKDVPEASRIRLSLESAQFMPCLIRLLRFTAPDTPLLVPPLFITDCVRAMYS